MTTESRRTYREPGQDGSVSEWEMLAANSIEVTRNAKGDYQWSIKRYYRPDEEPEQVVGLIAQIDTDLRQRYGPKVEAEKEALQ